MDLLKDLCSLTGMDLSLEGIGEFAPDPQCGISDAELNKTKVYTKFILEYGFLSDIPEDLSTEAKIVLGRVNNFFKGKTYFMKCIEINCM